jgi:adenosylcobinamide kinase / adenosylcobinamide-phosphate guanylyltransferase
LKILYVGGQKSGKTSLAITKALNLSTKPIYIATYINNYNDTQMQKRIQMHKIQRENKFITIEEGVNLKSVIEKNSGVFLIDCVSMWIFNKLENKEFDLIQAMSEILEIDKDIIFILNDVSSGVIPIDKLSREFIDYSGIIGQLIAKNSNEVYNVICGLENRLK